MNRFHQENIMFANRPIRRVVLAQGRASFGGLVEHLLFGAVNLVFLGVMVLYMLAIFSEVISDYQYAGDWGRQTNRVQEQVVAAKAIDRPHNDNPLPSARQVRLAGRLL
jgi:hypothetical protein